MIQRLLLAAFLCALANILYAQNGNIQGNISGTDSKSLGGITVRIEGQLRGAQTDDNGNFYFNAVAPGRYVLVASGIGYHAKSSMVTVEEGKTVHLRLELDIAASTLKEVSVAATRRGRQSSAVTRTNTPLRDLPQQIQSIDRSTLNDQQVFQLDEAFKNAAGITSTDYYGGFSSRGFTTSAASIITNGMKGSPYPEGQIALLGNIESVEVIHGPAAILNGPGGLGGNINLVTKQPKKFTSVNGSVTGGSLHLFRAQADFTGSITKKKDLYFQAGAGWQQGGSFVRDYYKKTLQLYGAVKWELNAATSWQVNLNYVNDDASNNYQPRVPLYNSKNTDSMFLVPYDFSPGSNSRYRGNNFQVQSIMEHTLTANWKLGLLLGFSRSDATRRQYSSFGFVSPKDSTISRSYIWQRIVSPQTTANLYTSLKLRTWKVTHQLLIGGDAALNRNRYPDGIVQYAGTPVNVFIPDQSVYDSTGMTMYSRSAHELFTYNILGAYVQDQIEITPKWKLLAGIRYNNYFRRYIATKPDGSVQNDERPLRTENFSPRIGLVYQPVSNLSVYMDYNEGFEPHYSNNAENGGPFDPETSRQYELGAKGEFLQGALQPFISIYQLTKMNVLQSAPKEGFPYWMEAIGEVQSRGVETGVKGTLFSDLFFLLNYNYNKTKITKSRKPADIGQRFANSPENTANGWMKYSFSKGALKGLFIGAGFQYVDSRYLSNKKPDNPTLLIMPAYTLMNALIGYRYKQYNLQVNGNNLADKRYASSGYLNAYTPGMPRSILVTFSCSFK